MKSKKTVVLLVLLLAILITAVVWFQLHQNSLSHDVYRGGMSQAVKNKFLQQGIDCQEVYEIQGYETVETISKMYGIGQHEFRALNPGADMQAGSSVCVKGIWGVADGAQKPIVWFWPLVAVIACAAGFTASRLLPSNQAPPAPHTGPTK